jgi:hypothetical protein
MIRWLHRLLCFFGFHQKEKHTKRVILVENRRLPTPSYEGIPADAQVNAQVRMHYITDLWEDHFTCPSCGRVRKETDTKRDILYYNQMIYLKGGRAFIAQPKIE